MTPEERAEQAYDELVGKTMSQFAKVEHLVEARKEVIARAIREAVEAEREKIEGSLRGY